MNELTPELCGDCYDLLKVDLKADVNLKDVILSDENAKKIHEFLVEQKYATYLHEQGYEPIRSLLLYGASGTGKTYVSRAIAHQLGYYFLDVDIGKAFKESDAMDNLIKLFKLANKLKSVVLLFDECDSIAWTRDTKTQESSANKKVSTEVIFQYLDTLNPKVVFIAATNMIYNLDAAFERRFDLKLEFLRPREDLMQIIDRFRNPNFELIDDIDENIRRAVQSRLDDNSKLSYDEIKKAIARVEKQSIIQSFELRRSGKDRSKYYNNKTNKHIVHTTDIYRVLSENMNTKIKFNITD